MVVTSNILKGVGALQLKRQETSYLVVGYFFDSASLMRVLGSSQEIHSGKRGRGRKERDSSRFLFLRFKELITRPDTVFWRTLYLPSPDSAILGNALIVWRAFDQSFAQEDIGRVFQAYVESNILPLIRILPGTKKINPVFLSKVIIPSFMEDGSIVFFPKVSDLLKLYQSARQVPISSALQFLRWIESSSAFKEMNVTRHRLHTSTFGEDDLEFPIFLVAHENRLTSIFSLFPWKKIIFTRRPHYYRGTILTPGKNLSIDVFKEFDSITIGKLLAITQGILLDRFLPDFLQAYNAVKERFAEIGKAVNTIDFLTELEELSGLTVTISTQARVLSALKPAIETKDAFFSTNLDYLVKTELDLEALIIDLSALQIEERAFFTFSCLFHLSSFFLETKPTVVLDLIEEMIPTIDRTYSNVNWLMDHILSLRLIVIRSNTLPWPTFPLSAKSYLVGGTTNRRLQEWIATLLPQHSRDEVLSFLTSIPDSMLLKISENSAWQPILVEFIPSQIASQSLAPEIISERSMLPSEGTVELNIYASVIDMFANQGMGLLDIENHIQSALGIKNAGIITTNLQRKKLITADFENPEITEKARMFLLSDDELREYFTIVQQQLGISSIRNLEEHPLSPAMRFWMLVILWLYLVKDEEASFELVEYATQELGKIAQNASSVQRFSDEGAIADSESRAIDNEVGDGEMSHSSINWEISPGDKADVQNHMDLDNPRSISDVEFDINSLPSSIDGRTLISRIISDLISCHPKERKSILSVENIILNAFCETLGLEQIPITKKTFFSIVCPLLSHETCGFLEQLPLRVMQVFDLMDEHISHTHSDIVSSLEESLDPLKELYLDYKELLTIRSKLLLSLNAKE